MASHHQSRQHSSNAHPDRPSDRPHAVRRYALGSGGFEGGIVAYLAGDHQKAFRLIEPLAEQGHAPAQAHLGLAFLTVGVDTVTTFAFQKVVARFVKRAP